MSRPDPRDVARRHRAPMQRTAGEVRFIKDRGDDGAAWAWAGVGPSERNMQPGFIFDQKQLKILAKILRSTLMALGHTQSAYDFFTKMKSADISPDGNLGGRGYVQPVADMRRQFMNCSEALSALGDTLYDEINAPHWNPEAAEVSDARERQDVREIMEDVEEIRRDPEEWAEEAEEEMDEDNDEEVNAMGKTASRRRRVHKRAYSSATDEALATVKMLSGRGCRHRLCPDINKAVVSVREGTPQERYNALLEIQSWLRKHRYPRELADIHEEIQTVVRVAASERRMARRVANRYLRERADD